MRFFFHPWGVITRNTQENGNLGDMFKVFDSLDKLVDTVDRAYGVPMTANCMVPRAEMQQWLDDLRDAIPHEMDEAQDVLDESDRIIHDAEEKAYQLETQSAAEADRILEDAKAEADRLVHDAEEKAKRTLDDAYQQADDVTERAQRDADATISRAHQESDALSAQAKEAYQRSVDEGLAEQSRLVSEAEVVRVAKEEAHRVVDEAHTESNRLRRECDEFVDSKLAEFEASLESTLRSVSRDRSALRRGAGASGASSRLDR